MNEQSLAKKAGGAALSPLEHFRAKIALSAADICGKHKPGTADAIIYATALEHGAELLTFDAPFEKLPGATFIAKIRP